MTVEDEGHFINLYQILVNFYYQLNIQNKEIYDSTTFQFVHFNESNTTRHERIAISAMLRTSGSSKTKISCFLAQFITISNIYIYNGFVTIFRIPGRQKFFPEPSMITCSFLERHRNLASDYYMAGKSIWRAHLIFLQIHNDGPVWARNNHLTPRLCTRSQYWCWTAKIIITTCKWLFEILIWTN